MGRQAVFVAALILAGLAATPASATPAGAEFQVNTYTTESQGLLSAAADAAGGFILVWISNGQDSSGYGVFGQRYSASGAPMGTEFQAHTYTPGDQGFGYATIDVSAGADGDFVIVWAQVGPITPTLHHRARRYDNMGVPLGAPFAVSTYVTTSQSNVSVAKAPDGSFVVAWTDDAGRDGHGSGVFARRFGSAGAALGGDFQLSTYTVGGQGHFGPRLAAHADGSFVAVWPSSDQDGSSTGCFGRRFDSSGASLGPEFQISTITFGSQTFPSVAADADGDFMVAWMGSFIDGSSSSVQAQRFDSTGAPVGNEFQVNTYTEGGQYLLRRSVFADADGRFSIVWTDEARDGSDGGVFARRYDSDGSPIGDEFQVNTFTAGRQNLPVIAGGAAGNFVVAWQSDLQDGSEFGAFAQRFQITALPTNTPTPIPPTATPTQTPTPTATAVGNCPSIVDNGCSTGFEKGMLLVKADVAGREKLIAKMVRGPALTQTAMGNPLGGGGTVYSLCIYDDAGNLAGGSPGSVVVDRAGDTCAASACWKPVGGDPPAGSGYKYKDTALAAGGVLKLLYKAGDAGKSKAIVKGKGPNLPDGIPAALQTTTFATVQLRSSDGVCLSTAVDDIQSQTPDTFKAKFSAP